MAPIGPLVLSAGKKAALASLGIFTGVGGAVAYQLDQVFSFTRPEFKTCVVLICFNLFIDH